MLSLFPQLFFLSPFVPTLLRISAGLAFLLIAWNHYGRRHDLAAERFILVGGGMWIPVIAALVELLVAAGLILGVYTQAIAIAAALLALKQYVWRKRYPHFFPLPRSSSALLFVMCLSLIITGAGALALDLPL